MTRRVNSQKVHRASIRQMIFLGKLKDNLGELSCVRNQKYRLPKGRNRIPLAATSNSSKRGIERMSKICYMCGKKPLSGNNVSHAHNITKRRWMPNLQSVRALVDGVPKKIRVCTSCLKRGKVIKNINRRKPQAAAVQ